jgi:pimeloyl-ACP methyl ester carboxylesterase
MPNQSEFCESSSLNILCVHGAGAGAWEWAVWSRVLAARQMHVVAPDLQPAAEGLAETKFAHYRQQLIDVVDSPPQVQSSWVLVGASLGGLLALSVAQQVQAKAVVLINPMPPGGVLPKPFGDPYPEIVPWGRDRSIMGTCRALPDADDAARMLAFRNWRDESGQVLEEARLGVDVEWPNCPMLVYASEQDDDVPPMVSRAVATRFAADFERLPDTSHAGPLLGRQAARIAERTADWIACHVASSDKHIDAT